MRKPLLLAFALASTSACGDDPNPGGGPIITNNVANNGTTNNGATNGTIPNNGTTNNGLPTNNGSTNNGTNATNNGTTNNGTNPTNNGTLPMGNVCMVQDPGEFTGQCDPVANAGCPDPQQCIIAVRVEGPDAFVSSACIETDMHTRKDGDVCVGTSQRCEPGTFCIDFLGICRKLCWMDDGTGCEENEWCDQPSSDWKGVGYCNAMCEMM